jgi:AraC-like DNA-binding protein
MQESDALKYQTQPPEILLADFVKCFWCVTNPSSEGKRMTILPDGYFDIIFSSTNKQPLRILLIGLGTKQIEYVMPGNTANFAISFKLLSLDYVLKTTIAGLVDKRINLPGDFWDMERCDLSDFNNFVKWTTEKMLVALDKNIDNRKRELSNLLYASNGSMSVQQISKNIFWSGRQINEYFTSRFGISLKKYCNILRFRASFDHLKSGQLFPELNYFDQAHFIKEVRKFSGVTPKKLAKNKDDRFIQFSTLPEP